MRWTSLLWLLSQDGSTPLLCAVEGRHERVAQLVLEAGANVNLRTLVRGPQRRCLAVCGVLFQTVAALCSAHCGLGLCVCVCVCVGVV